MKIRKLFFTYMRRASRVGAFDTYQPDSLFKNNLYLIIFGCTFI